MSHLAFAKTSYALRMVQASENQQTIVGLEILAALIPAWGMNYVQEAIELIDQVTKIPFFIDYLTNLCRIRQGS